MVDPGFDLIAVDAFTWTPALETTVEILLRESARGRRVAFAFLDIENVDHFWFPMQLNHAALIYRLQRAGRMRRVRALQRILADHGVTVLPNIGPDPSLARITCADSGIETIDSLRDFRLNGAWLGIGVLSSLIRQSADSDPDFVRSRERIERLLNSASQAYVLTRRVIDEYQPRALLVFNGRFACSRAIVEAARMSETELLYHESVSAPQRFYLSSEPVHSARSARWQLAEAWRSAGADRDAVAATFFAPDRGGLELLERRYLDSQVHGHSVQPSGRRRITFFTSSIDEYAAVEEGLEQTLFESQHTAASWLASWVRKQPDTELVIRMHPRLRRLSARELHFWNSLAADNVAVLPAESPVDTYALTASADRVVCFHSSVGVEATYLGKVSILVGDADYRGLDCVYEPRSVEELEAMLMDRDLPPKPARNCLPFGYQRLMRGLEYRFYRPTTFREGSFFGHRVIPDGEYPTAIAYLVAAIYRLSRATEVRR